MVEFMMFFCEKSFLLCCDYLGERRFVTMDTLLDVREDPSVVIDLYTCI